MAENEGVELRLQVRPGSGTDDSLEVRLPTEKLEGSAIGWLEAVLSFTSASAGRPESIQLDTGQCSPLLACQALAWLLNAVLAMTPAHSTSTETSHAAQKAEPHQLQVTPANVAQLLGLADYLDAPRLRGLILKELRQNPMFCGGLQRPTASTHTAIENVPQVAMLLEQAMQIAGDADGGLACLQADCLQWLADNAARAWPTRSFSALSSEIKERVLQQAIDGIDVITAFGVFLRCQQLQASLPSVSWACNVAEMAERLRSQTLAFIWANFVTIMCSRCIKKELASPWALTEVLTEVSTFAKQQGPGSDMLKALLGYQRVLDTAAALPHLPHLQDAVQAFYCELRAFASGHFSVLTNTAAWRGLPKQTQQQLLADLQVLQLPSHETHNPLAPGHGSSKGGTMFIIDSGPGPAPALQRARGPPQLSAATLARQRRSVSSGTRPHPAGPPAQPQARVGRPSRPATYTSAGRPSTSATCLTATSSSRPASAVGAPVREREQEQRALQAPPCPWLQTEGAYVRSRL